MLRSAVPQFSTSQRVVTMQLAGVACTHENHAVGDRRSRIWQARTAERGTPSHLKRAGIGDVQSNYTTGDSRYPAAVDDEQHIALRPECRHSTHAAVAKRIVCGGELERLQHRAATDHVTGSQKVKIPILVSSGRHETAAIRLEDNGSRSKVDIARRAGAGKDIRMRRRKAAKQVEIRVQPDDAVGIERVAFVGVISSGGEHVAGIGIDGNSSVTPDSSTTIRCGNSRNNDKAFYKGGIGARKVDHIDLASPWCVVTAITCCGEIEVVAETIQSAPDFVGVWIRDQIQRGRRICAVQKRNSAE